MLTNAYFIVTCVIVGVLSWTHGFLVGSIRELKGAKAFQSELITLVNRKLNEAGFEDPLKPNDSDRSHEDRWIILKRNNKNEAWSNEHGWVELGTGPIDVYSSEQQATLKLPMEGAWKKLLN